jgi:hypothetical protein
MPRINQIQMRRDTAANWTATDPTLAAGEWGLETDTRKAKVGNGVAAWTALTYWFVADTLAITDTYPVASQAAMLAVVGAEKGDIAVRSDTNQTFILSAEPASTLANWVELKSPTTATMTAATGVAAGVGGVVPTPPIGADTQFLRGDATWASVPTTAAMTGATGVAAGTAGTVPAPAAGQNLQLLRGDATWTNIIDGGSA